MKTNCDDFLNKRFGKLKVIGFGRNSKNKRVALCVCDCGTECSAYIGHLNEGRRVSCGCNSKNPKTHGMRRTRVYSIWCDMLKRCNNLKSISYRWYGAKGIKVCERWESFENFFNDMGEPADGMSIDRINPKGNYEPENCRWADSRTQTVNRDCQKLYELEGELLTLPEVAKKRGIKYRTLRSRMFRTGMTFEQAISHNFSEITESGMNNLKSAVIASNIRRGQQQETASKGIR